MKVIINESKLGKVVSQYISMYVGEELKLKHNSNREEGYSYFITPSGEVYFEYDNEGFGVREDLWEIIKDTFNLEPLEVDEYIIKWVNDNIMDISDFNDFYTFLQSKT